MKEHVRDGGIAARVRMLPHEGVFLLVEGGEDARVYGSFVDRSSCRVVVAHGKPTSSAPCACSGLTIRAPR